MQPTAEQITADASWHLQRWDLNTGKALLVLVSEQLLNEASFLDQRIEPHVGAGYWFDDAFVSATLQSHRPPPGQPGWLFHIGHCGSTLLSRALSEQRDVLPLREPLVLRQLAQIKREQHGSEMYDAKLGTALSALSRRFSAPQNVVVKPTSICHSIAADLLAGDGGRRAIGLCQSLRAHLGNLLGKQATTADIEGFAMERDVDWRRITGNADAAESDDDRIVRGWLVAMHDLLAVAEQMPGQMRMFDFDQLLQSPLEQLAAAAAWMQLDIPESRLAAAWQRNAGQYSKQPGTAFSPEDREHRLQRARQEHGTRLWAAMERAAVLCGEHEALAPCAAHIA